MTARSHTPKDSAPARSAAADEPCAGRPPVDLSDEELLARVAAARDRAAFRVLFERYAGKLRAFLIRGGAAPEEAEEATQEALTILWRRAETFDPERASAAAWIFTIARNRRIDLLRRGARPQPDPDDPLFQPDPPEPAEATLAKERRDAAVRAALSELGQEQLRIVRLSFFEGLAHAEIAERLGVPLGTVKSRLRLAFRHLRRRLGVDFADELNED